MQNPRTTSTFGHVTLMVAHCAGMVDLVALPVWVGTLIQHHQLDLVPSQLLAHLDAISGRQHGVAGICQVIAEKFADFVVIVDNQQRCTHC